MKYILARNDAKVLDYLGFGSRVGGKVGRFLIVAVRDEHVSWQLGRLMSGLLAGCSDVFDSIDEAVTVAEELSGM